MRLAKAPAICLSTMVPCVVSYATVVLSFSVEAFGSQAGKTSLHDAHCAGWCRQLGGD